MLGRDESAVMRALPVLGIEPLLTRFPCPLPDHSGGSTLYRHGEQHSFKIACWCRGNRRPVYHSLGQVLAMQAGRRPDISPIETAVWYRRLFFEAGEISPLPLQLRALPGASAKHRLVRDGFALLVGLRWLTHSGQPVAYGKGFASAWSAVAASTAQLALNSMKTQGVMVEVHVANGRSKLYLPGEVDLCGC